MKIEEIKNYIQEIQKDYKYKKVILFGSRANNTNKEDSDIDLLVEFSDNNKSLFLMANLINNLENKFGLKVDIIPYPQEKSLSSINLRIDKEILLYG